MSFINSMTPISANRGEWSELYAICYLIINGGGFSANEFAKIDKSVFYKVLQIVDNATGMSETIYKLNDNDVEVLQNGLAVYRISKGEIASKLEVFFRDLLDQSNAHAFNLASGEALMKFIKKDKLSASSALTSDVHLVLEDRESKLETPRRGFSVKSELGSPATIFNASGSTNLVYQISGPAKPNTFQDVSGVKTNLITLVNLGYKLKFQKYDNPILEMSLENIDSNLPTYLAELMLNYYLSKTTNLANLCEVTFPSAESDSSMKISKIKKFLSAASMGLKANQLWSGYPGDFGGMLLVKETGDVLFYYLYNMQKFEEYLYRNLRFETPSATRHGFGQIYEEDGKFYIKLNLQIRF